MAPLSPAYRTVAPGSAPLLPRAHWRGVVRDVLRFEEIEGQIARLRFFAFCPETLAEVVGALGLPLATNGYGVWAPEFLEMQKQEEFQQWMAQRANEVEP